MDILYSLNVVVRAFNNQFHDGLISIISIMRLYYNIFTIIELAYLLLNTICILWKRHYFHGSYIY